MSKSPLHFVIIGATGNIGRGVAKAALNRGAKVAIVGRNLDKLKTLKQTYLDNSDSVYEIEADISTYQGALKARNHAVEKLESIDNVFVASGPWWHVPRRVSEVDEGTFVKAFQTNVFAHYYCWKAFSSVVQSTYMCINGAAANNLPQTLLTGVCANSVEGLCKLIAADAKDMGVNFKEIMLNARVADDEVSKGAWPSLKFGEAVYGHFSTKNNENYYVKVE